MNISGTEAAFRGDGKGTTIVHFRNTSEINGDSILYLTHIVHPTPPKKKKLLVELKRLMYNRN